MGTFFSIVGIILGFLILPCTTFWALIGGWLFDGWGVLFGVIIGLGGDHAAGRI